MCRGCTRSTCRPAHAFRVPLVRRGAGEPRYTMGFLSRCPCLGGADAGTAAQQDEGSTVAEVEGYSPSGQSSGPASLALSMALLKTFTSDSGTSAAVRRRCESATTISSFERGACMEFSYTKV